MLGKWVLHVVVECNAGTCKEVRVGRRCLRREQVKKQLEASGLGTFHPPPPGFSPLAGQHWEMCWACSVELFDPDCN